MIFVEETEDSGEALHGFLAEVTIKHIKHCRGQAPGADEICTKMLKALDIFECCGLSVPIFKNGAKGVLQLSEHHTAVPPWEIFMLEMRLWMIIEPQIQQE